MSSISLLFPNHLPLCWQKKKKNYLKFPLLYFEITKSTLQVSYFWAPTKEQFNNISLNVAYYSLLFLYISLRIAELFHFGLLISMLITMCFCMHDFYLSWVLLLSLFEYFLMFLFSKKWQKWNTLKFSHVQFLFWFPLSTNENLAKETVQLLGTNKFPLISLWKSKLLLGFTDTEEKCIHVVVRFSWVTPLV